MNKNERKTSPESVNSEELQAIYDQLRREFTAADLQKYTEIETEWVPAERVLADMEKVHRAHAAKKKKRRS